MDERLTDLAKGTKRTGLTVPCFTGGDTFAS
jgi:hypothetical protein